MSVFGCFLNGEALVHLRGAKIADFLQGQLTCDTRRLTAGRALPGALCNPKGRVLCDLKLILVDEEHCMLRLRSSLAAQIATTLQRYAQFSRISVEADTREAIILGIYGALENAALDKIDLPPADDGVTASGGLTLLRHGPGFMEFIAREADAEKQLTGYASALEPGSTGAWQAEFLAAEHYALEEEDSGLFTPQALNYDRSGRVAFDKGCYTGQEVVARLHYKGQSKRRLAVYQVTGASEAPARETPVLGDHGVKIGSCLRCETDRLGRDLLAAQVSGDAADQMAALPGGGKLTTLGDP